MQDDNNITKGAAIDIVNKKLASLTHSNTVFSNVNKAKPVWWFEPNNELFDSGFNLILANEQDKKIYYFFIPAGAITKPQSSFNQRVDLTNRSGIEIKVADPEFKDCKGPEKISFRKYLIKEITY